MFLALYLHPVKHNAEKRRKENAPHLDCIVCRCCLGSIYPQLDVSCRCLLCLDNKQMLRLPILKICRPGIVSAPPPPLSLRPACCPRVPAPCHTSHVTLRHTCHAHLREAGPWLSSVYLLVRPVTRLWAWPLVSSLLTIEVSRHSWSQY